jgi:hypothetical protein
VLSVIINPNRYRSKASAAFIREVLPQFSTHPTTLDPEQLLSTPYTAPPELKPEETAIES